MKIGRFTVKLTIKVLEERWTADALIDYYTPEDAGPYPIVGVFVQGLNPGVVLDRANERIKEEIALFVQDLRREAAHQDHLEYLAQQNSQGN